jgi:hypothetical protein
MTAAKIEGRVQPRGGAWRPIVGAHMESGKLIVAVGEAGLGSAVSWELTSPSSGKLNGIEKRDDVGGPMLAGVKAPSLDRQCRRSGPGPSLFLMAKILKVGSL